MKANLFHKNIPKEWQKLSLGEVSDVTNGKTNSQDAISDGEYPLFDRSVSIKRSNKFLFDGEAIILPGEGAEFVPKYYKGKFDLHQRAYAIFAKEEKVYSPFLFQFLFANRDIFAQTAVGSTVKSLRLPIINKVSINIPPISEQKKIAEILSSVDEDIQKVDDLISKTEALKKGLMKELFTKGVGHKKFKKTKIGFVPDIWNIQELGKICDVRDGTHDSPKYKVNGIPMVTSKNLVERSLDFRTAKFISEEDYLSIERRSAVDDGDILFGMIGTIGNPILVKKDRKFAIKNVALIKFFKESEVLNTFLIYYLESSLVMSQFNQKLSGSTQKFISLGVIRKILVLLPDIDEQKKIADVLSSVDEKINLYKKLKEKLIQLKKGLMSTLLSGKVRVK
jgi:type I restriction enzyme S subunit